MTFGDIETAGPARELAEFVGRAAGRSRSIVVTQERISAFGEITEDRQWIHMDPPRAERIGGTIAHGMLIASLIPVLLGEIIEPPAGAPIRCDRIVNLGFERLSFATPVRAGTAIHLEGNVVEAVAAGRQRVDARCDVTVWTDTAPPRVSAAGVLRLRFLL
ncbi:hypothetical protein NDR87_10835 [Nocardia sp. CDC159]|uniref:MaoC-like domain-containing protein n=1 Tax=Nocardia pulmonis TaxID=2951408 RepID=A0A9X2IYI8_9NOCA|nr:MULTISPECIES: MaoC/PaaZ C-terminal domain-containing protein [Nocardia]MCM6773966.1 hypothetical protein [Nocardia pulmonis]MCM6786853.1 hypothetical protein [Nocardia sp. CDC159]